MESQPCRSPAERADHEGKAALAAETARSMSLVEASWTSVMCLSVCGLVRGKVLVGLLLSTKAPSMKRRVSMGLLAKSADLGTVLGREF